MKVDIVLAVFITIMITAGTYLAVQRSSIVPEQPQVSSESEPNETFEDLNQTTLGVQVKASLIASPKVSGLEIDVDKKAKGHIVLDGYVRKDLEKDLASTIALKVDGVRKVTNKLEVDENIGVDDAYQPFPTTMAPDNL